MATDPVRDAARALCDEARDTIGFLRNAGSTPEQLLDLACELEVRCDHLRAALERPAAPAADAVERARRCARRWATDAVIRALNAVGVRESNADDFAEIVGSSVDAAEAEAGRDGKGGA